MSPSRRITVHDVAARAGVSQPTVSLVLSRNPRARIAPETRERVLRAAEELGYRTNLLARGLTQQRSWALGLVVLDLRNPFFADVVAGAERVATEEGYALLLTEAGEGGAARRVEALQARLVDGVIIDAVGAAALPEPLLEKLNVVLIDEPSERWPGVASDAAGAGRLAAEHLLDLGHRRIGFIGPATDVHGVRLRERGFVQALRERGVRLDSGLLRRAPGTASGGREAMRAMLAQRERPTAVFCSNDLVAVGALKACADAGVVVPRDCSVVGCDDIEMARFVSPELTTVAIPARELGARAARLLIRRLADAGADAVVLVPPMDMDPNAWLESVGTELLPIVPGR
ncbi:MAG TPA: LacI family DNA-binding transcriptional regulator [Gemmatimonadaceae bacterium]